ncbi:hypothetical protein FF38_11220 [Lucilia cuprina]|uniref:Uncharacterized protein n=1 Tax=Lucilia cuprina TaxID=7375 RepID=A0A0L0BUA0_LUCCU|nr:hypothetical protein CVS40_11996 [Lucilia cuprina]KNC23596.1 hypothetical protein FF38_11220 [Lucilia cuprina]
MYNMWSIGSSLSDEVSSAEFSCINNDRYRNFVTGLHLQSLTQRHHFPQQKSSAHRIHPKTQQQQNNLRNNISNQQYDARFAFNKLMLTDANQEIIKQVN